jgi:hypothetical protein
MTRSGHEKLGIEALHKYFLLRRNVYCIRSSVGRVRRESRIRLPSSGLTQSVDENTA